MKKGKQTEDSLWESQKIAQNSFQKIIRNCPLEVQVPAPILYIGNISDLWDDYIQKLKNFSDIFAEKDYEILKESLTCGRIYFLNLVIQSIQEQQFMLLKGMVESFEYSLRKEWLEDLSYDSEEVLKSEFFEHFVRKNKNFVELKQRKKVIKMFYQLDFSLEKRKHLNIYFQLALNFINKVIIKETIKMQKTDFEFLYLGSVLKFTLSYPSMEQLIFSNIMISDYRIKEILKKNGVIYLMRSVKKMDFQELKEQQSRIQKAIS